MEEQFQEERQKEYNEYVKRVTPTHSLSANMVKAFLIGGAICTLGQLILNTAMSVGLEQEEAASWCTLLLIALSVLLTGLNLYPKLAKLGGAGTLVPITGFANSVVSPALEFKSEGLILGLGAKMFIIAGPVLVYGITASVLYGVILVMFHLY